MNTKINWWKLHSVERCNKLDSDYEHGTKFTEKGGKRWSENLKEFEVEASKKIFFVNRIVVFQFSVDYGLTSSSKKDRFKNFGLGFKKRIFLFSMINQVDTFPREKIALVILNKHEKISII